MGQFIAAGPHREAVTLRCGELDDVPESGAGAQGCSPRRQIPDRQNAGNLRIHQQVATVHNDTDCAHVTLTIRARRCSISTTAPSTYFARCTCDRLAGMVGLDVSQLQGLPRPGVDRASALSIMAIVAS